MDTIELPGDGPWQRFIIKFRDGTAPRADPRHAQARLDRAAAGAAESGVPGLRLAWLRRLGIGADVFAADRPLGHDAARWLMRTLAQDHEVEFVEVDAVMRAFGPGEDAALP